MQQTKQIIGEEFFRPVMSSIYREAHNIDTSIVTTKNNYVPGTLAIYHFNKRLSKSEFEELSANEIRINNNGPAIGQAVILDYKTLIEE